MVLFFWPPPWTIVDDVFRCYEFFSQFFIGCHGFPRHFHGISWSLVGFLGFSILKFCISQIRRFGVATLCFILTSQEQRNIAQRCVSVPVVYSAALPPSLMVFFLNQSVLLLTYEIEQNKLSFNLSLARSPFVTLCEAGCFCRLACLPLSQLIFIHAR